ncbi:hypothetical protein [Mucilaginibacter lacusdianchii]|uniref:hypothetical protein n=1 Tax=Mucilaginibacter lacusdianchii TaxID=2684211 RepID=UPI00131CD02E|nr:hypothetical protein [Mucilaginibacter sp. JXJ CY 39]
MKRFSIILATVGLVLLIGSNFLFKTKSNSVDTGGSVEYTTMFGGWTPKIPVFMGAVLIGLGAVFYYAAVSKSDKQAHHSA